MHAHYHRRKKSSGGNRPVTAGGPNFFVPDAFPAYYDLDTGFVYMIQEKVDGVSLAEKFGSEEGEIFTRAHDYEWVGNNHPKVVEQIEYSLEGLLSCGIIFKDRTPYNFMICNEEDEELGKLVYIIDFGHADVTFHEPDHRFVEENSRLEAVQDEWPCRTVEDQLKEEENYFSWNKEYF